MRMVLLTALVFLLNPIAARAIIVSGYFEGYATTSNVYAGGTAARLDFTYDTSMAPVPSCSSVTGGYEQCVYQESYGTDWLTTTLTIGSDVYTFNDLDSVDKVLIQDAVGAGYSDYFVVHEKDYLNSLVDGVRTYEDSYVDASVGSLVDDFITGTTLPSSLSYTTPEIRHGYFQQERYVHDYNTGQDVGDRHYVYSSMNWFGAYATVVPIPAAAWLFGSALIGLVGIKLKK